MNASAGWPPLPSHPDPPHGATQSTTRRPRGLEPPAWPCLRCAAPDWPLPLSAPAAWCCLVPPSAVPCPVLQFAYFSVAFSVAELLSNALLAGNYVSTDLTVGAQLTM